MKPVTMVSPDIHIAGKQLIQWLRAMKNQMHNERAIKRSKKDDKNEWKIVVSSNPECTYTKFNHIAHFQIFQMWM